MKKAREFKKLVSQGNVKVAIRLITEQAGSGSLSLSSIQPDRRTVKDHLLAKHPPGVPASPHSISDEPPVSELHPNIFEQIDGPLIRSTVLRMNGSAGPSSLDAKAWKCLCTLFHSASADLCASIANLIRRLCTFYVHLRGSSVLTACHLIALNKCPGVRPMRLVRHSDASSSRLSSEWQGTSSRKWWRICNYVLVRRQRVRPVSMQ